MEEWNSYDLLQGVGAETVEKAIIESVGKFLEMGLGR